MELNLAQDSLNVYKALASDSRLEILNLLANTPMSVSLLAQRLSLSKAIVSRHLSMLEHAGLIHIDESCSKGDQRKKIYTLSVDEIHIKLPKRIYLPFKKKTTEIQLGYYSDFHVSPTCGLASRERLIGEVDDPRTFVQSNRVEASLLWFSEGYVEYLLPNTLEKGQRPELLELSLELSSEFPGSNNNWPSDISFTINGVEAAVWTCPGNFSDVRGHLTPSWWSSRYSQYGMLKHLRINHENTGIDGRTFSDTTLADLKLKSSPFIHLRIGICDKAANKGGVTIFGEHFGNHPQNILLSLYYSEESPE